MNKTVTRKEISELVDRFGDMVEQIYNIKKESIRIGAELADIIVRQTEDKKVEKKPCDELGGGFVEMKKSMDEFFDEVDNMFNDIKKKQEHEKKDDMVHHPKHYRGKMECIDAMEKEFGKTAVEWFCLLNAFKYEYRKDKKGRENEDTKKCGWYIDKFNNLRKGMRVPKVTQENLAKLVNKYK